MRGKGDKERVVPLGEEAAHRRRPLPARRAARTSRAARMTRSSSPPAAGGWTRARCAVSCRTRTAFGTPSRRTCSRAAPTCARSRSCSGTRRSRRRRSTATSTRSACAASTTAQYPRDSLNAAPTPASPAAGAEPRPAAGGGAPRAESVSRTWRPGNPHVERFLLLLAARRSPRTVDAYRRDLAALTPFAAARSTTPRSTRSSSAGSPRCGPTGSPPRRSPAARRPSRSYFRHTS